LILASIRRPLIGITSNYEYEKESLYINKGYCDAINKIGGLAVIIPFSDDIDFLENICSECDGFLISGGPDVEPKHYGEENLPINGGISPLRDFVELFFVKKALENNKPVFGICRGVQVINVALGGTLYQDIHMQIKDRELIKHRQEAPKWYPTHEIIIEKGSRVWKSLQSERIGVNSFHHQAIKTLAPGMVVTSRAPDGIIESIEHSQLRYAVGVQWHPEIMWQKNSIFLRLFADFVDEAGR
jgi:putative glutamine amidotransferase